MLKLPSAPVEAKKGCGSTPAQACIQPCTLHSNGNMTSTVVNERFVVMVVGWLMLNGRFFFPIALMLWRIPSLFLIARVWPTMIPFTRVWYMHPLWSISTGVVVVVYLALHLGSSLMSIAGLAGAFPTNLTLPVTVEPASAAPPRLLNPKPSAKRPAPTTATEPNLRIVPPLG